MQVKFISEWYDIDIFSPTENHDDPAPVPTPRKSLTSPPLGRKNDSSEDKSTPGSAVTGRRGRFAALAQSINDWEDDLTHHVIQ